MGIWARMNEHLDLMSRMFAKTGAFDGNGLIGEVEMDLKNAMVRCLACAETDVCREWLDRNNGGGHPPEFCANAELIERMRSTN